MVVDYFGLDVLKVDMGEWIKMVDYIENGLMKMVKIVMVGKYIDL